MSGALRPKVPPPTKPHGHVAAHALAVRLLARERERASPTDPSQEHGQGHAQGDAASLPAERLMETVCAGLSRWFGEFGARALIARALSRAQTDNPPLAVVTLVPPVIAAAPSPYLAGLDESSRTFGAGPAADAVVALLACLVDLVSRLIGEELAFAVIEQSAQDRAWRVPRPVGTVPGSPVHPPAGSGPGSPGAANEDVPFTAPEK